MATEITPELQKELRDAEDVPVEVIDPETQQRYVILKVEFYERIRHLIEYGELTEREKTAIIQDMGKSVGWEDPSADDLI